MQQLRQCYNRASCYLCRDYYNNHFYRCHNSFSCSTPSSTFQTWIYFSSINKRIHVRHFRRFSSRVTKESNNQPQQPQASQRNDNISNESDGEQSNMDMNDMDIGDEGLHFDMKKGKSKLPYHEFKRLGNKSERSIPQKASKWWRKPRLEELEYRQKKPTEGAMVDRSENVHPSKIGMQTTKLSKHGNADSLFLDCLDRIRHARQHIQSAEEEGGGVRTKESPQIEELTRIEKSIIYKILKRVDPAQEVATNLEYSGDYIDPFWNPFKPVQDIKKEIHDEFTAFSRLHSTAEAMRQHQLLKRKYQIEYNLLDPLRDQKDRSKLDTSIPDDPKYPQFAPSVPEKLWDPSTLRRKVLYNNNRPITWRDLHILKFFVSESGMFLPRRLTMATRRQQTRAFKAVKQAQGLGVFPYDWRPPDTEQMKMEDPLQFMTDILTLRYKEHGDLRAEAMLKVMMRRFKKINYRQYLMHSSQLRRRQEKRLKQTREERRGDFKQIVDRYNKLNKRLPLGTRKREYD